MMNPFITSSYNQYKELYQKHFAEINGIKFTIREIDIIACIIHNRGEKKIASICNIAVTTVSTHARNIMTKLGSHSKDQIIDFIEKAGFFSAFQEHYRCLLIKLNFETALKSIASKLHKDPVYYYFLRNAEDIGNELLYKDIISHLKMANIVLSDANTKGQLIDIHSIKAESYYYDLLQLISQLIDSTLVKKIISEFEANCQKVNVNYTTHTRISRLRSVNEILGFKNFIMIFLMIVIIAALYPFLNRENADDLLPSNPSLVIKNLEKFLSTASADQFTADNITKERAAQNQSVIKRIEKILQYRNLKEVEEYFNKAEMPSEVLMKYLHTLHALSSYYMYNENDGIKAREILLYIKHLAENYVQIRSKIQTNFNNLTPDELFTELQIIKHLPEIYSRIIYSLGRTYIYTKEFEGGRQYFKLARYLGWKLNIYEGYLSYVAGILAIEKHDIEQQIREQPSLDIVAKIKNLIDLYNKVEQDHNDYIMDYDPLLLKQKTIKANNSYNILCCQINKISLYHLLIKIDSTSTEKYIKTLANILEKQGDDNLFHLLNAVNSRKKASLYNELGYLMLTLWNKEDYNLEQRISARLNISSSDGLDLSEKLFEQAKLLSREMDYTKADAYDGLIMVYQTRLEGKNIPHPQKQILESKITECIKKRDLINNTLHREQ